jgi:fructose-1,6-bisphosphatase/inositol monophosphatase family enzyme
MWLA